MTLPTYEISIIRMRTRQQQITANNIEITNNEYSRTQSNMEYEWKENSISFYGDLNNTYNINGIFSQIQYVNTYMLPPVWPHFIPSCPTIQSE